MEISIQNANNDSSRKTRSLREHVLLAIDLYFNNIKDDGGPLGLHTLVIEEVEAAMYESAMKFTKGNQVQAAKVLGVARGTLRTKLKQYFGTTQVGGLYHKYSLKPLKVVKPQPGSKAEEKTAEIVELHQA